MYTKLIFSRVRVFDQNADGVINTEQHQLGGVIICCCSYRKQLREDGTWGRSDSGGKRVADCRCFQPPAHGVRSDLSRADRIVPISRTDAWFIPAT